MKSTITIRKAAPIPPKTKTTAYPFEAMKVNESFIAGKYSDELVNRVNAAASYYGKKLDMKFCLRKDGNNLTVWRAE